ncbi:XRE family transcriptional regulator [Burkholderia ubonensis]|nr:XRE family transcriptional regulator [Burkholderia ubonensis]
MGRLGRKSLSLYESDERAPDTSFLLALRTIGVDIVYVLTGERSGPSGETVEPLGTDAEEAELIATYRQLNETGKATLRSFIASVLNQAIMLKTGTPQRAKRLPENRRAALDERTAENVQRAMAEIERLKAERAKK